MLVHAALLRSSRWRQVAGDPTVDRVDLATRPWVGSRSGYGLRVGAAESRARRTVALPGSAHRKGSRWGRRAELGRSDRAHHRGIPARQRRVRRQSVAIHATLPPRYWDEGRS